MRRLILTFCFFFFLMANAYPMTMEEAVMLAHSHNTDLRTLRFEENSAIGRLEKARLILNNNPTIEGNISKKDKSAEDGSGTFTNYGFNLSQEFEISGQRSARIKAAENDLASVKADITNKERVLTADVKDAFIKGLALKKKISLTGEIVKLKEEFLGYAKIKFQAGDVSSLDVNLAEVEFAQAKREHLLLEREQRNTLIALQGFCGVPPDMSLTLEGNLSSDVPVMPDKKRLKELALSSRPDAKAMAFDAKRAGAELELSRKEIIPHVTLSGFYERDESRDVVGLGMSIPIPIFDRKQAERKEAHAKAQAASIRSEGLKISIASEIELAFSDLIFAIEELSLFKKEIISKAEENLTLLNLAFKEGKVGFFEVRLAQKDTIEAQFAYIEAQARTQLALNGLEKITGGTLK